MRPDPAALTATLCEIALRAGREILAVYASDFTVRGKADASPVTEADTRAERVILEGLEACAPGVPVVAEESAAAGEIPDVAGRSSSSIPSTAPGSSSTATASSR